MVYRFSWLAAALGVLLALARLNRLIRPSVEGAPWQLLLVAALLLGGAVTWTVLAFRKKLPLLIAANLAAALLVVVRIAAPATTWFIIPTWETARTLATELRYAADIIRSGSAPVLPSTGLMVLLMVVFWAIGALAVWGLQRGHPFVALIPPAALYLHLATVDRIGLRLSWSLGLLALIAVGLAAVTLDERTAGVGRLAGAARGANWFALPGWSLAVAAGVGALALLTTAGLSGSVPPTGVVSWRYQSGLTGDFYGSVSYNPFVNVQKDLINPTNTPVFVAQTEGNIDGDELYWRLLTLDTFNGAWWFASGPELSLPDDDGPLEDSDHAFAGPTETVGQEITILGLSMDWLPAAYAPVEVSSSIRQVDRGIRVAGDGSLRFGSLSFESMTYRVTSEVPVPDLAALAVDAEGEPTRVFQAAIEEGDYEPPEFVEAPPLRDGPPDRDRFLALPEELDPRITELAEDITNGLDSDYEKALALESYLRNPSNGFRYDTTVAPAGGAEDLGTWLFDDTNPDWRSGYCEQYAGALGVMGRAAGIPSRIVLGFTPGTDIGEGRVVVRDNNAHAWVEFWMPSQGWVRFDATPRLDGVNPSAASALPFDITPHLEILEVENVPFAISPLVPPPLIDEENLRLVGQSGSDEEIAIRLPGWLTSVVPVAVLGGIAVLALPAFKWARRRRRLGRLARGDVAAAWSEITSRLTDLGAAPELSQTPAEYAAATHPTLAPLAAHYGEAIYGKEPLDSGGLRAATRSFTEAEQQLRTRYGPTERFLAAYRLKSLLRKKR